MVVGKNTEVCSLSGGLLAGLVDEDVEDVCYVLERSWNDGGFAPLLFMFIFVFNNSMMLSGTRAEVETRRRCETYFMLLV